MRETDIQVPTRPRWAAPLCVLLLLVGGGGIQRAASASATVDFNRDVRPILSGSCFKCHGIDDKARKAKLRLDVRESAVAAGSSGETAIVPGKPEASELVRRIFSDDPDEAMPPSSTRHPLTDAQKQTLRRWIAEGAVYAPHWAFVAPARPALPVVKQADWPRNPIDRFVLARLEAEGLSPAPEADRYALARRVYLDLIGLPPTPTEADAFVNDAAPDAYEKLVDQLLARPDYGERWARRWLDLARYADTNGYEKDRPRSIWPYRDWVIAALNADMPFDRFTIEQLAGDMLPNATPSQRIATGFHRNTMLNEEGGIDPLEFRYHAVVDRVGVTGATWLGLTVACAQCHTHKFDPITHREYYGLMAFLNDADEPVMEVPDPEIDRRRREGEAVIAARVAALAGEYPAGQAIWRPIETASVATDSGATAEHRADGSWRFAGADPERDAYTFTFTADAPATVDRIRLEVLKDGDAGPGRTPHGNFVLTDFTAAVALPDAARDKPAPVKLARAQADVSQANFDVAGAIDADPASGWAIVDGKGKVASRTATFFFDKPLVLPKGAAWTIRLNQQYGQHHTLRRLRMSLGAAASDDRPAEQLRREALAGAVARWEAEAGPRAVQWTVLRPVEMTSTTPTLALQEDDSILASGDIAKSDAYDLTFGDVPDGVTAVRLEAMPDPSLPRGGPGMIYYEGPIGDFCLSEITLAAAGRGPVAFKAAAHSFAAGGNTAAAAIDGNPQTGWMIDGGQGKSHQAVFALAGPLQTAGGGLGLHMQFERHFAPALGHFRLSFTTDPRALAPAAAFPPEVEAALATPTADRTPAQGDLLTGYYLSIAPEMAGARKEIDRLRAALPQPATTLVMKERPPGRARTTHLHNRGEFLQPKDEVTPTVPAFLPPLPQGAPLNRLTLARWIASPENPLTARVAVNRQWAAFFGRGIVATLSDFGFQGEWPSHPQLLDWLALRFIDDGWSMKRLHRLIVTSATYRQSSSATPEAMVSDPLNVLLSRGPRFRVEAEIIRDAALRESGLLTTKIGGPSVFPPQPPSVTTEGAYGPMTWTASNGPDRYRRSLYTFTKRTAPFALYNAFDAPTGEACIAQREVSNTPLQALALLNDQVFLECARALGAELARAPGDDADKARLLFRRCLTRPPTDAEASAIAAFVARQRERFTANPQTAAQFAGAGDDRPIPRAAWTAAARVMLNVDEAIVKP